MTTSDGRSPGAAVREIVFNNVPQEPPSKLTIGPAAVRDRMAILSAACVEVRFDVLTQVEQGNVVMNERVDTFRSPAAPSPRAMS